MTMIAILAIKGVQLFQIELLQSLRHKIVFINAPIHWISKSRNEERKKETKEEREWEIKRMDRERWVEMRKRKKEKAQTRVLKNISHFPGFSNEWNEQKINPGINLISAFTWNSSMWECGIIANITLLAFWTATQSCRKDWDKRLHWHSSVNACIRKKNVSKHDGWVHLHTMDAQY